MNITVLQFSPSGNTSDVTTEIINALGQIPGSHIQLVDITKDSGFFTGGNPRQFLESKVKNHDLLLIGSPVYAHHLQYHMKDLLSALPASDLTKWGRYAIPYVTYGGISSGIALEEASTLLRKTGRTVIGGMKFSASHRMTRAFLPAEFNEGKPGTEMLPVIGQLEKLVRDLSSGKKYGDMSKKLRYQSRIKKLVINTIFNEKKWHKERYPKVAIDHSLCTSCGACVSSCPVLHLETSTEGFVIENERKECIHCLNCVAGCPNRAVSLIGDLEKGKSFMTKMIRKKGNTETPSSAFYC